jgi:hypothetical protein
MVYFVDGIVELYDVVIPATGYKIAFPFFAAGVLDYTDANVPLYLKVFSPDHKNLAFVGLVQPQGCIWPLADTQAQLVANYVVGNYELPADIRARIQQDQDYTRRKFVESPRHALEVEYYPYLEALRREMPANAPVWDLSVTA